MKYHLVSGACGFVGRNLVKRILKNNEDRVIIVDNLSTGIHPDHWLTNPSESVKDLSVYENGRVYFFNGDFRTLLNKMTANQNYIQEHYGLVFDKFTDVFHFAAIVGGRAKIDGDPMMVAIDLAIDAEFFYWVCNHKPARVMYPSSSAAYPIDLQSDTDFVALKESDIDFDHNLGKPDMTYGW
jgi:nucleoside-diphosphate-sugar epimerase